MPLQAIVHVPSKTKVMAFATHGRSEGPARHASKEKHRMVDYPNNVLVIHHFDNVEIARAFVGRSELRDAMQRSGVQGEPRVELFE